MQIEQWFPIHIGYAHNPFHKEIEDELTQQCLKIKKSCKGDFEKFMKEDVTAPSSLQQWYRFTAIKLSYQLLKDQKFSRLHSWIDDQINEYTEKLRFFKKLKCVEGWFNVYEKYEFTDYHDHRPNILSCVYFLNCEEEAGAKLLIRNNHDDLIVHCESGPVISSMYHNPFPGKLVVFSSDTEHAVQQHNTDNLRITLAYNYT